MLGLLCNQFVDDLFAPLEPSVMKVLEILALELSAGTRFASGIAGLAGDEASLSRRVWAGHLAPASQASKGYGICHLCPGSSVRLSP